MVQYLQGHIAPWLPIDFSDYENIELFVKTQSFMEKSEKCRFSEQMRNIESIIIYLNVIIKLFMSNLQIR